jgi:hypothetical protein
MMTTEDIAGVTSEKQIAANRINGQKSSGPRTARGKAKASRNALRHGLEAVPDDATLQRIGRIVDAICGSHASALERELAAVIAESQVLIARVRGARIDAIERMRTASATSPMPAYKFDAAQHRMIDAAKKDNYPKAMNILMRLVNKAVREHRLELADEYFAKQSLARGEVPPEVAKIYVCGKRIPRSEVESACFAIPVLVSLERYERRAISRRRHAIATLDAIRYIRSAWLDRGETN